MAPRKNNSKYVLRGQGKKRRWQLKPGMAPENKERDRYLVNKRLIPNKRPDSLDVVGVGAGALAGGTTAYLLRRDTLNGRSLGPYRDRVNSKATQTRSEKRIAQLEANIAYEQGRKKPRMGRINKYTAEIAENTAKLAKASTTIDETAEILSRVKGTHVTPRVVAGAGALIGIIAGAGVYGARNAAHKRKMARKMQKELDESNGLIRPPEYKSKRR